MKQLFLLNLVFASLAFAGEDSDPSARKFITEMAQLQLMLETADHQISSKNQVNPLLQVLMELKKFPKTQSVYLEEYDHKTRIDDPIKARYKKNFQESEFKSVAGKIHLSFDEQSWAIERFFGVVEEYDVTFYYKPTDDIFPFTNTHIMQPNYNLGENYVSRNGIKYRFHMDHRENPRKERLEIRYFRNDHPPKYLEFEIDKESLIFLEELEKIAIQIIRKTYFDPEPLESGLTVQEATEHLKFIDPVTSFIIRKPDFTPFGESPVLHFYSTVLERYRSMKMDRDNAIQEMLKSLQRYSSKDPRDIELKSAIKNHLSHFTNDFKVDFFQVPLSQIKRNSEYEHNQDEFMASVESTSEGIFVDKKIHESQISKAKIMRTQEEWDLIRTTTEWPQYPESEGKK